MINAQKIIVFIIISFFKLIKTYFWIVVFCCVLHSHSHRDRIWILTQDIDVEM